MWPIKCIAIKRVSGGLHALLLLVLLFTGTAAYAGSVVGTIMHLSGALLAKKADGTVKVLSQQSTIEEGDTLVSEKETYAHIKFIDNSEITLRPNSQFKINHFSYDAAKPEGDSAIFNLIKGGLRAVTGLLGKRNRERFGLNTPTATIGIRGTIFIAEYIPPEQPDVAAYGFASLAAITPSLLSPWQTSQAGLSDSDAPLDLLPLTGIVPLRIAQNTTADGRAPGLYVHVLDGMINLTNSGGSQSFAAGQFGYTPSFKQPPVVLPVNPGMQFTPPPSFSSSSSPTSQSGGTSNNKPSNVDCEVR